MKNSLVNTINTLVGMFVKEIHNSELKNFDNAVINELLKANPTKSVIVNHTNDPTCFYEHVISVRLFTDKRYKKLYDDWNYDNIFLLKNLKHLWMEHVMKNNFVEYTVSFSITNGTNINIQNTYSEEEDIL